MKKFTLWKGPKHLNLQLSVFFVILGIVKLVQSLIENSQNDQLFSFVLIFVGGGFFYLRYLLWKKWEINSPPERVKKVYASIGRIIVLGIIGAVILFLFIYFILNKYQYFD